MKKVIMSLLLMMGLTLSVNAAPLTLTSLLNIAPMPAAFITMVKMSQIKYEACNDKPFKTVSFKSGSNHLFDVSECDYQKNRDTYK